MPIDPVLGCLLGGAVGDALGAPYEGLWGESIPQPDALLAGFGEFVGYPTGQFTDDTQLTLATVEALVGTAGEPEPASVARAIADLWRDATVIGPGGACTGAADRLLDGVSWQEAGAPVGQAGNGTAMRAAVLGLLFPADRPRMLEFAADVCRITHRDPRSVAGGLAIARFTHAVAHESAAANVADALGRVCEDVRELDGETSRLIDELIERRNTPPEQALPWIAAAGQPEPEFDRPTITPFVLPTVLACLYAASRHLDDWGAGVAEVIGYGGDVDTTGAIVGGILGARNGPDSIPEHLRSQVVDRQRIESLARQLTAKLAGRLD